MTETHECRLLLDYFNDCLTPAEKEAFEQHVKNCPDCREELDELLMLTENLPYASEAVEPNAGMKDRVLAAVFSETNTQEPKQKQAPAKKQPSKQVKRWMQPLLAASLLLSLGANAYFFMNNHSETAEPATASVIQDVQLAAAEGFSGTARATLVNEETAASVILQAEQLKELTGTEAYQVWLIDEAGQKVRAGTFRPNENGSGAVSYEMPDIEKETWEMIAVTLEPTPESAQPLGDIVLAAEL